jgi:hypothetical protein
MLLYNFRLFRNQYGMKLLYLFESYVINRGSPTAAIDSKNSLNANTEWDENLENHWKDQIHDAGVDWEYGCEIELTGSALNTQS